MKKRILSCLMALALCLTLLPTAALAEEPEGAAQTSPAVEESKDPANGEAKQEKQPAEQEEQQEDSAAKQDETVAAVQALSERFSQPAALAEGTGHTNHPICGANCTDGGNHTTVENWQGVDDLSTITEEGNYFLIKDVTLSSTWEPKNGVVLCLNGNSITATGDFNAIKVKGNTFTLCDCGGGKITHAEGKTGIGVYVINGTFIMHGGSITGNRNTKYNPYGKGGGVMVEGGAFEMHGGSITDNSVSGDSESCGGGVFVNSNCRFTMDGGSITGNTATGRNSSGGGVYVSQDGTFTVSGKVNITGNKCKYTTVSNDSNVFLPCGDQGLKSFTIGEAGLVSNSKIGVATDVAPNPGHYLTVATLSKGAVYIEGTIISDRTDGCAIKGNGNNIILYKGQLHAHPVCCEASCKDHPNELWQPISDETGLQNATEGHYYLTKAIELKNVWKPARGVVLCLNGQSITAKGSFDAIEVGDGVTFTLTDCSSQRNGEITHDKPKTGCGVKVLTGGTFKMYDGWIAGNTVSSSSGGGVYVIGGTFEMHGGNIGGNTANYGGGVSVVEGGTFKMYDGRIIENTANRDNGAFGGGVYVSDSGSTFEMSGSASITKNKANGTKNRGGGVYVASGTFTMTGDASITENWAYANDSGGGGVYVSGGSFNMNGGKIEGNTAAASSGGVGYEGGGVYVEGGTFTMTGGAKISGNKATSNGGGVYVTGVDSKFTVSGKVNVTGNHESYGTNKTDNNVYLYGGKHITIDGSGLDASAKIGVICASLAPGGSYTVATGATNPDLPYGSIFIPDEADRGYVVTKNGTELVLSAHQHSWRYALKEGRTDTITATCENCPLAVGGGAYSGGSVTIKAPISLIYDGTAKWPEIQPDPAWQKNIGEPTGVFTCNPNDTAVESPVDAGEYEVTFHVMDGKNAVASVKYSIKPAIITVTPNELSKKYGEPDPALTYTATGAQNGEEPAFTGSLSRNKQGPENGESVGKYDIYKSTLQLVDKDGFKANNYTLEFASGKYFTIGKGDQTITVPSGKTIVKNGEPVNISGWASVAGVQNGTDPGALSYALDGTYDGVTLIDGKLTVPERVAKDTVITIKVTAAGTDNYNKAEKPFTVKVTDKQPVNLSVSMDNWTYGGTANTPQYTVPDGVTATVTYAVKDTDNFSTTVPSNAGEYTVKVTYETDSEIHTGTKDFTIAQKTLQQGMLAQITGDRYYNGAEQTPDVTVTDGEKTLVKDVDYTVSYSNNRNASTPTSQAVATVTGKGNYEGAISTKFVINPVTLSIMGGGTATASYGTKVKEIPVSVSSAEVFYYGSGNKPVIVPGTWKFDGDGMDDIPEVGNTKEYKAVFTPTSGSENYRECSTYITPSITQAAGSVTAPAVKTDLVYNGEEQALLETLPISSTGTVQYSLDNKDYTETPPMGKEAKTYTVFYKVVGDKNHLGVAAQSITVKIEKRTISVKADNKSMTVNGTLPTFTVTYGNFASGDSEATVIETKATASCTADGKSTGSFPITVSGTTALKSGMDTNYEVGTPESGTLTVSTPSSGGGSRPSTHPVKTEVSKDPDGSVSLSKTNAAKGDKVTVTVKPDRHYEVDEVIVRDSKGKQLAVKDNGDGTFTFEMPADKVTVEPTFSWVNPFADVADSAYYVDAVEWMLKREVTQGTTETTFSPNLNCTRAQIVTFLWRAAGSPEPKGTVGFADVSAGSYYAKAVAWAIENGITGGTGDGLFSPDATCTRAQSAAFLYRAAGSPAVSGSAGFSDVAADAYYASAVAWAKEHGITDGIGGGLFGSANDCTRAQIAAFLYRCMK